MSKVLLRPWGEFAEIQLVDFELLDICEGREVLQALGIK